VKSTLCGAESDHLLCHKASVQIDSAFSEFLYDLIRCAFGVPRQKVLDRRLKIEFVERHEPRRTRHFVLRCWASDIHSKLLSLFGALQRAFRTGDRQAAALLSVFPEQRKAGSRY